jgi:hypothetical protein
LPVIGDAGLEARSMPQPGIPAVGTDHQPRLQPAAAGELQPRAIFVHLQADRAFRDGLVFRTGFGDGLAQGLLQGAALDDVGELAQAGIIGTE